MLLRLLFQEGLNCKAFPAILRFYWDVLNSLRDRPTIVRKGSEVSRCFQVHPLVIVQDRSNGRMLMALPSLATPAVWVVPDADLQLGAPDSPPLHARTTHTRPTSIPCTCVRNHPCVQ